MANHQALTAVLPPTVHKIVLFFWWPHLQENGKVQVNLEQL
jgi:hypothetical protein